MDPPVPTEPGLFPNPLRRAGPRLKRPCTRANAKIMKPARLRPQLGRARIYAARHFRARRRSGRVPPGPALCRRRGRFSERVVSARLFIHARTHNEVHPHYRRIGNMSPHVWETFKKIKPFKSLIFFSIFVALDTIRDAPPPPPPWQRCELRRVNNQQIKGGNCFMFSSG